MELLMIVWAAALAGHFGAIVLIAMPTILIFSLIVLAWLEYKYGCR